MFFLLDIFLVQIFLLLLLNLWKHLLQSIGIQDSFNSFLLLALGLVKVYVHQAKGDFG